MSEKDEVVGNVPDAYREEYEKALEQSREENQLPGLKMEKTEEKATIAGYKCIKYKVVDENDRSGNSFVWLTDKITIDFSTDMLGEQNQLFGFISELGFPLKIEGSKSENSTDPDVQMEAVKVSKVKLNSSLFDIPDNYQVSDLSNLLR